VQLAERTPSARCQIKAGVCRSDRSSGILGGFRCRILDLANGPGLDWSERPPSGLEGCDYVVAKSRLARDSLTGSPETSDDASIRALIWQQGDGAASSRRAPAALLDQQEIYEVNSAL
jgi:hypothetical protein